MANNRLYLRCLNCGEELYIGKIFEPIWELVETDIPKINEFLFDHAFCNGKVQERTHAEGGDFMLVDEWEDERKEALIELWRGDTNERE